MEATSNSCPNPKSAGKKSAAQTFMLTRLRHQACLPWYILDFPPIQSHRAFTRAHPSNPRLLYKQGVRALSQKEGRIDKLGQF